MKTCIQCKSSFEVHADELEFIKNIIFTYGNKKFTPSEPEYCPDCRQQLRVIHRNEQYLYQVKSDLSDKQLISIYNPEIPHTIYSQEEWNSDQWDPMSYGRDFDFSRPFFDQFHELLIDVPRKNLITLNNENSPYTTGTAYCKNCYLINSSENCEDCYYGKLLQVCKSSIDCSYLYDSELCYECFNVKDSYACFHLSYSQNCSECWFSDNLRNCKNCFLCTNLEGKEYYFMNEPLSKEEYKKRVEEFKGSFRNFQKAREILQTLRINSIHKYSNLVSSENCTGDFIQNSRNCLDSYDLISSQDSRYLTVGVEAKDCYDCSNMYMKPELSYQVMGTISTFNVAYSTYIFHSQNILYSDQIYSCSDLFGCSSLTRKKYCVFNKQYSKEDYEDLVPRIIEHMNKTGEWGQFFPPSLSPHAYNESLASEYYPLTSDEVGKRGWRWYQDGQFHDYKGPQHEFTDNINDASEDIVKKILKCEKSGKFYKIIPQELKFYKNFGIPIPRLCPDERHKERMSLRNPRHLWARNCMQCGKGIQSTYAPDRPEKIYCEECFLKNIY